VQPSSNSLETTDIICAPGAGSGQEEKNEKNKKNKNKKKKKKKKKENKENKEKKEIYWKRR
jgi:ribosomal protein L12E/L44/L45/RPP1/RPP2